MRFRLVDLGSRPRSTTAEHLLSSFLMWAFGTVALCCCLETLIQRDETILCDHCDGRQGPDAGGAGEVGAVIISCSVLSHPWGWLQHGAGRGRPSTSRKGGRVLGGYPFLTSSRASTLLKRSERLWAW